MVAVLQQRAGCCAFTHAYRYLSSFNQMLKKSNFTPHKLPSLSQDLLPLYQDLSQIPKQAQQSCQNVLLHLNSLASIGLPKHSIDLEFVCS